MAPGRCRPPFRTPPHGHPTSLHLARPGYGAEAGDYGGQGGYQQPAPPQTQLVNVNRDWRFGNNEHNQVIHLYR